MVQMEKIIWYKDRKSLMSRYFFINIKSVGLCGSSFTVVKLSCLILTWVLRR